MAGRDSREIVIPHDLSRGPLVAVRRMLVHASIAEIRELGTYDRYCKLMDARSLAGITELIGPGWLPVELALAHYTACDKLALADDQIYQIGVRAGDTLQDALLVAATGKNSEPNAKRSPWDLLGAFSRMGRRVYTGSSAQYVKLDERRLLIENVGNPLFGIHYYCVAHAGFMRQAFTKLGVNIVDVKLASYRSDGAQQDVRITWK